jgi:alkylhydroperoxidase family enzyme
LALISYVDDEVYQKSLGSPQVGNVLRALFLSPNWAKCFVHLASVQMNGIALPPIDRELVILHAGHFLGAEYVVAQHGAIAEIVGITKQQQNAIKNGNYQNGDFSKRQQALLNLVQAVANRNYADDAVLAEAKRHFSDQELIEIVGVHGVAYTVSSITSTFRIEVDLKSGEDLLRFASHVAGAN